jgi:hypothetical protein
MKRIFLYKRVYLIGLLPVSYLLIVLAKINSYFAEEIYAKYIYRGISQIISAFTGLFPFSIAELIVITLPIVVLVVLLRFALGMLLNNKHRGMRLGKGLLNILCAASVTLFLFVILGGINYYRSNFSSYSNLIIKDSSIEELYALTKNLALEAVELRAQTTMVDDNGVFKLSMKHTELAREADRAFQLLAEEYPVLGGNYSPPKPVLLSKLMSSTEITGIFFPFTMEANVNVDVPDYSIPATMLHELAHLRGFMREDEANFLAYLAGMKSEHQDIRYSSTMLALITSGNALYDQNPDYYFEIRELYSDGVLRDIRANSEYWLKYEDTAISTISNKVNDTYLKANAQADGVQSYGRMLDLLLAKYRKEHPEAVQDFIE